MRGVCDFKRTCMDLFTGPLNPLNEVDEPETRRFMQGIIPDHMIDATALELSQKAAQTFSSACTLTDVKTIAPGQMYSESSSETHGAVVAKRQSKVSRDYHNAVFKLDQRLLTVSGEIGAVEKELNNYNSGDVVGPVVGAFAELSDHVHSFMELVSDELTADYMQFFDLNHKQT